MLYELGTAVARLQFTLFSRWKVEGQESIPPRGPLIIAANHLSNADPPVVVASSNRKLHSLAKEGLFKTPVGAWFFSRCYAHPVKEGQVERSALRWALRVLERDGALLVFPEGARSRTSGLQPAMPGIGYLAFKSQAPVLPVAVTGTEHIPGYWRIAFPFCKMNVRFGEPFTLPAIEGRLSREILQQGADMVMERIAQLLPPGYRGHYSTANISTPHSEPDEATPSCHSERNAAE